MSSKNIFSLDRATVPLAGTEVIPIWDGTATVKVTIANLTADRVVDVLSLTAAGTVVNSYSTVGDASYYRIVNTDTGASSFSAYQMKTGFSSHIWQTFCRNDRLYIGVAGVADYIYIDSSANFNNIAGNYVPLTANKGINFTANPHAAGMTNQLLNGYEEGTWTPTLTAGSGTITTVGSCTGKYTRMGRCIVYTMDCTITTNGTGGNYILVGGFSSVASLPTGASLQGFDTLTTKTVGGRYVNANAILMRFADGTYPGADGANFLATIVVNI